MKYLFIMSLGSASAVAMAADDLQKRVETLEYASFENSLSWSGFFESRFDAYTVKPATGDKYTLNISRNVAGIDFKSQPLPNVSIFGRLAYSNVFNNYGDSPMETNGKGRSYNSSFATFERLFINYGITDALSFSVGRLPTLDGPPTHLYDNLSRQGSYPRQVYSSALDGYALTYKIPLGSETQSLSARLVYTPLSNVLVTADATGVGNYDRSPITATDPSTGATVNTGSYHSSTTPLTSWMLDYAWNGSSAVRNLSVIYQGFNFKGFEISPTWKFDYTIHTLYVEAKDIASLGLTVYESYTKTKLENKGGVSFPGGGLSFGANELDATVDGTATITGLTYTLPVEAIKNPSIGYEMYKGDKGSTQFDLAGRDTMGFYVQRGTGTHIFYSQPLNANIKIRLGLMDSKPDYAPGLLPGEAAKTDDTAKAIYANLRTDF